MLAAERCHRSRAPAEPGTKPPVARAGKPRPNPVWDHPVTRVKPPGIQTKREVGEPGDAFEREADRLADQVMRMRDAAISEPEEELDPEKRGVGGERARRQRYSAGGSARRVLERRRENRGGPSGRSSRCFRAKQLGQGNLQQF